MKAVKNVDEYIASNAMWQENLKMLREILLSSEQQETIKWGAPVYTFQNKNIAG